MDPIYLPCGGFARFDLSSGISYRCEDCGAVVGSIGMPGHCKDELDKYNKILPALGSKIKWDFQRGEETEP